MITKCDLCRKPGKFVGQAKKILCPAHHLTWVLSLTEKQRRREGSVPLGLGNGKPVKIIHKPVLPAPPALQVPLPPKHPFPKEWRRAKTHSSPCRTAREALGISQRKLAELALVKEWVVIDIETGRTSPGLTEVLRQRVAEALQKERETLAGSHTDHQ